MTFRLYGMRMTFLLPARRGAPGRRAVRFYNLFCVILARLSASSRGTRRTFARFLNGFCQNPWVCDLPALEIGDKVIRTPHKPLCKIPCKRHVYIIFGALQPGAQVALLAQIIFAEIKVYKRCYRKPHREGMRAGEPLFHMGVHKLGMQCKAEPGAAYRRSPSCQCKAETPPLAQAVFLYRASQA